MLLLLPTSLSEVIQLVWCRLMSCPSVIAASFRSDGIICVGGKAVVVAEDKLLNYNLIYEKP